jgi:hypothetical protein
VSGSDWVAIAGVATGGVVSIAVTGLNYWFQDRGARRQAQRERQNQLRDVLDSAGGAVSEAVVAAQRRVVAQGDALKETGEAFADKFGTVQLFKNRIAIRLGNADSVAEAYRNVVAELQRVSKKLYDAHGELDRDAQKDTNELIGGVKDAQLSYLESARAVVDRDL